MVGQINSTLNPIYDTDTDKLVDQIGSGVVGSSQLSTEDVEDLVGAMAGTNITYDDSNGTLDVSGGGVSLQAPSDVSGSRSLGNTYTNNTGNPLFVSIRCSMSDGDAVRLSVDTAVVEAIDNQTGSLMSMTAMAFVPDGSDYQAFLLSGSPSISNWFEQEVQSA